MLESSTAAAAVRATIVSTASGLLACMLAFATTVAVYRGGGAAAQMLVAALCSVLSLVFWQVAIVRRLPSFGAMFSAVLVPAILALSVDGAARLWQVPLSWKGLGVLSDLGATAACATYFFAMFWSVVRSGRPPSGIAAGSLLATPYLFNLLLLLASPQLMDKLGGALGSGWASGAAVGGLGRTLVLILFNEMVLVGVGLLMDRRWTRSLRLHLILVAGSALAAFTPQISDWGAGPFAAALPTVPRMIVVTLTTALAQAGLWAQTFVVTGVLLNALHGQRPTVDTSLGHWRSGWGKGAVYGGVFILIVQIAALLFGDATVLTRMREHPLAAAILAGMLLFPLAKTLVESFDGSAPLLGRLAAAALDPVNYLRGAIAGAGLGLALADSLWAEASGLRFGYGFLIGALAYAGADLLWDLATVAQGRRQRLQAWPVYALGAGLGGLVAGALAWYFDAGQVAAVTSKFWNYAAVYYPAAGKATSNYVIYPLFSKWGAMNLGSVGGGARLLYNESLSGVINWSLAAPLFSINLVALTALFQRSSAPLKELFSGAGMANLVEQTVRVLRWGLWMAPIIYSFLRLAPDPTWYNQDGAIRTVVATIQSWTLTPSEFRAWSLNVFLGLLAYDWLRMLIWFDHMGLRVATLVNLSFVGGDALDEKAARLLGHSARTRCIPEGIRRFLTWAPLLIPFYIPRGADWDYVWGHAEPLHASSQPLLPEVLALLVGYRVVAVALVALAAGLVVRGLRRRQARLLPAAPQPLVISNGFCTAELHADGRGYSRVVSAVRKGYVLDITRRPDDPLQVRGKFLYLRDSGKSGELWSLGEQPVGIAGPDCAVTRLSPTRLHMTNSHDGLRAAAVISVADGEAVETWRVTLTNLESRRRTVELTSYQELALAAVDSYRRSPSFAGMHVGTCFIRPLGAIFFRNRLVRDAQNDPKRQRMSREVGFHAAGAIGGAAVRLTGYEDSRAHFIGRGTLRQPAALAGAAIRSADDEGLLHPFDPAATLRLEVDLEPGGTAEVLFVDGYAEDEQRAADSVARQLGLAAPGAASLDEAWRKRRALHRPLPVSVDGTRFEFSDHGKELHLSAETPRPWHHLLANPLGYGAVVGNDGEIFSFAGNAQQNGLTPFGLDTVPSQLMGQAIHVMDLDTGEPDTAHFSPHRRSGTPGEVVYGRGYAVFRKTCPGLQLELTAFVLPEQLAELRLLRIRNTGSQGRRLRVAPYAQIMLAETPVDSRGQIETREDAALNALYFSHSRNDFRKGWAFAATNLPCEGRETVRARFVGGRPHDLATPHLLVQGLPDATQPDDGYRVAGFVGTVDVPAGTEVVVTLMLGQADDPQQAAQLIRTYVDASAAGLALEQTRRWWDEKLSVLRVETDHPEFDRLVNDWLPYQLLTSRLWGRTGPNQRSGAYGFRDQLQDVLPLVYWWPQLARQQIVLHAAQQFREGDVLKWWHPSWEGKTGIGVRTAASDPHLWLPYVVSRYVVATGDYSVLDENVAFLEGQALPARVEGMMIAPRPSRDTGSIYEHCRRAIELALSRQGSHGLPLLGSGDWNDGIDVAGLHGRGESVWMGFFLHDVLVSFAPLAERREGAAAAVRYLEEEARLRQALEGFWRKDGYLRALTDDGEELKLTSALMAAWPVLSGAVELDRGLEALEAGLLALEKGNHILLLTPPFTEHSQPYPGRLADYPPGVRENGGQYSHGASWLVDALLRCADLAATAGRDELAARCHARALEIWLKISPLSKTGPDQLDAYGLAPHQQPADVYDGAAHDGRGGWSWYTGAAARMLSAAYGLLGLSMRDGELRITERAGAPERPIALRRVIHRGKVLWPAGS